MGIESDAQNDLSLSDGAAEDVVGGKKKAKAGAKAHKTPAHKTAYAANYINVQSNVAPQPYVDNGDDCEDPSMDSGAAAADDTSAS